MVGDVGVLDVVTWDAAEFAYLRPVAEAPCALCGRVFPVGLLVAAHIKRRAVCDDDERNDLRNVAMLACSFGCDRLFELGHITVDDDGAVLVASTGGSLDPHLEHLKGRVTDAFHERSAGYFRWHRRTVFRGRTGGSVGGIR
ncbi:MULTISPECIES: HNH endonuclease [Saccharothrix]|uniref:HNH endonuclease n=1 Tax=Saccharothrix TaxID=2071 RepID=UPI001161353D|nr:HNH endonuclease [Saccharothrix sp. CB00851]